MTKMYASIALAVVVGIAAQAEEMWNDDFSGSLNANFTKFKAGEANAVQVKGHLVFDMGVTNNYRVAGMHTHTDQAGTLTEPGGVKLYDFYSHSVELSFCVS